jgi:TPR repeat protein
MGLMLLNGWGVTANPAMALKLFTSAADQGSSDGQFHVGQMVKLPNNI